MKRREKREEKGEGGKKERKKERKKEKGKGEKGRESKEWLGDRIARHSLLHGNVVFLQQFFSLVFM